jgi:hypothetical protein
MKLRSTITLLLTIALLPGCGDNKEDDKSTAANTTSPENNATGNVSKNKQSGLVGDWEQQYTCFDTNGNNKLDAEEKKPSNTRTGFDWFRFNSDGSCLRDKDMKFKSTYEVKEKGNTKELMIQNVHGYQIVELTEQELILGAEGAFIVFKKIA